MSEELRRALQYSSVTSLDLELFLPDLNGKTEILTEEHRRQLCRHLPARAEGECFVYSEAGDIESERRNGRPSRWSRRVMSVSARL